MKIRLRKHLLYASLLRGMPSATTEAKIGRASKSINELLRVFDPNGYGGEVMAWIPVGKEKLMDTI